MMAAATTTTGMPLAALLEGFASSGDCGAITVSGIQLDSRRVQPGDLFVACQGLRVHGLRHAAQAVERGAAAVLWESTADESTRALARAVPVAALEVPGLGHKLGPLAARFYAQPSRDMHVIGVTGTDGKTSVTHFLAQALSAGAQSCGLLGTLGYGVYGSLRTPTHTTPDALTLQAELACLRDAGVPHVAMEVSSHALHQHRSDGVAFDTAVLTHLSRDHLDYHGSVEAYAEAKRRLFTMPDLKTAVLNIGDDFGRRLVSRLHDSVSLYVYGHSTDKPAAYAAHWLELVEVRARPDGIAVRIDSSAGAAEFTASLLGGFNAENLLATLGALLAAGLALPEAVHRLSRVRTVPGRMELFARAGAPRCVVDYAHTPHALETALRALRAHCRGELICIFGAGGDRDMGKRPAMGAAAEAHADQVVVTSDNPRGESPQAIMAGIVEGFREPARARQIVDRGEAIDTLIAEAAVDDLILVAGKGHEDYQQVGEQRLDFSDRLRVQQALRRRAG